MSAPAESRSMPASASSAANNATATGASNDTLTQSDFLQLMVTQMQNQDPTSPADPSAFLGQLAQMSEVSSLSNMQQSLATLSSSLLSSQAVSGASLVGHDVLASGTSGNLAAGGSLSGAVQAPAGATSLSVAVTDASGNLVSSSPSRRSRDSPHFPGTARRARARAPRPAATISPSPQP